MQNRPAFDAAACVHTCKAGMDSIWRRDYG